MFLSSSKLGVGYFPYADLFYLGTFSRFLGAVDLLLPVLSGEESTKFWMSGLSTFSIRLRITGLGVAIFTIWNSPAFLDLFWEVWSVA